MHDSSLWPPIAVYTVTLRNKQRLQWVQNEKKDKEGAEDNKEKEQETQKVEEEAEEEWWSWRIL